MSGQEQATIREVLEKAYERLLPAVGYLISSQAGFAASVVVFTTWLMRKIRRARAQVRMGIERDEETLVALKMRIDEARKRRELLRRALGRADPWERRRIERSLRLVEEELEELTSLYELVELRILAVKRLQRLGEAGVLRDALRLARLIEEGKLEDAQYRVLRELEEEWRRRQASLEALRRIVEAP